SIRADLPARTPAGGACSCGASGARCGRPAPRHDDVRRLAARARPIRAGDRAPLEPDRPADAQPRRRRRIPRARDLRLPNGADRRVRRVRPGGAGGTALAAPRLPRSRRAPGTRRDDSSSDSCRTHSTGHGRARARPPRRDRARGPRRRRGATPSRARAPPRRHRHTGDRGHAGSEPDRQRAPPLRPPRARRAARRGGRLGRAVDLRPHGLRERRRRPAALDLAVGRRRRAPADPGAARRAVEGGARRDAAPGARRDTVALRCDTGADGDVPSDTRDRGAASTRAHGRSGTRARGSVDRHGLAGHDGGRRPERPRGGCRGAREAAGTAAGRRGAAGGGRMSIVTPGTSSVLRTTLDRGVSKLLELQHPDGYWKGELETNVTIDAEDLFLRHFLGLLDDGVTAATALWIRSKQREDGSWATFHGGPPDLSTTVEAYVALRLAGDDPAQSHMRAAQDVVQRLGGLGGTRVFTRMWLALLGAWSWDTVPVLPPEQLLLPARAPLCVYSFACWARQTIVALQVATALQPVRPLPFGLDELARGEEPPPVWFDRLLHAYGRRPLRALRRFALRRAVDWIVERQEADGSWGGIQPPWVWSLIALHAYGLPLDAPPVARGLKGLDGFTIEDEAGRRIEACQSPVWDTALAVIALLDAGLEPSHPAVARAAEWIVTQEIGRRGDWARRRPQLAPGGWAFEFANEWHPDIDDTAEVVMALRRAGVGAAAADRGTAWMLGMQSRNGGWAAFDVDNTSTLPNRLPFCDFGEVTDPPSADVTAHVLEALALEGRADDPAARRGIAYLLGEQEDDGSWFGRWGANHIYGTGAAVPALVACGLGDHESIPRTVEWLHSVQNEDGGFS